MTKVSEKLKKYFDEFKPYFTYSAIVFSLVTTHILFIYLSVPSGLLNFIDSVFYAHAFGSLITIAIIASMISVILPHVILAIGYGICMSRMEAAVIKAMSQRKIYQGLSQSQGEDIYSWKEDYIKRLSNHLIVKKWPHSGAILKTLRILTFVVAFLHFYIGLLGAGKVILLAFSALVIGFFSFAFHDKNVNKIIRKKESDHQIAKNKSPMQWLRMAREGSGFFGVFVFCVFSVCAVAGYSRADKLMSQPELCFNLIDGQSVEAAIFGESKHGFIVYVPNSASFRIIQSASVLQMYSESEHLFYGIFSNKSEPVSAGNSPCKKSK